MNVTNDALDAARIDPVGWRRVERLADEWCRTDAIPAAAIIAGRGGAVVGPVLFGRARIDDAESMISDDAIFLVASITKPVVATGALLLIERGLLSLGDRVTDFLPEFGRHGKSPTTIRHLVTHTSGLPDMLPNNVELRSAHSPLSVFVDDVCEERPIFPPGRGVQYQSMGFAVLGAIIERVTGKPCAEFLRDELFQPLGMRDTALGAPEEWFTGDSPKADRIAEIRLPDEQQRASWNWNDRYWRMLGAPWGGLLTTPADLAKFAQLMLADGKSDDALILSPAAIRAATRNQLEHMRGVPADDRRCRPWGIGWRLQWPDHSANFGDLLGPRTYGHWGATGTVLWIDPDAGTFAIVLTTEPQEPRGSYLAKLSNVIAASFQ